MGKIVRLTESDLVKLIKQVIKEQKTTGSSCDWSNITSGLRGNQIILKDLNGKMVTFDHIKGIEGMDKQGINIYLDKSELRQIQMTPDKRATMFKRNNNKESFRGNPGKWECISKNGKTEIKLNFYL